MSLGSLWEDRFARTRHSSSAASSRTTLTPPRTFHWLFRRRRPSSRLRSLFPSNPRLDLYLKHLGDLRGTAAPINILLGLDPVTGVDRGSVQFATASLAAARHQRRAAVADSARPPSVRSPPVFVALRVRLSSRTRPAAVSFPGFINDQAARNQNFLFADSFTFSSSFTNEFRFSYGRLRADDPTRPSPRSVPEATYPAGVSSSPTSPAPAALAMRQFRLRQQPAVSGDANQTDRTPHVPLRRGVPGADGDPAAWLNSHVGSTSTATPRATPPSPTSSTISADPPAASAGVRRDRFSPRPVPPVLLFPGHLEGGACPHADAGAPLREFRPAGERAALTRPSPASIRNDSWSRTEVNWTTTISARPSAWPGRRRFSPAGSASCSGIARRCGAAATRSATTPGSPK